MILDQIDDGGAGIVRRSGIVESDAQHLGPGDGDGSIDAIQLSLGVRFVERSFEYGDGHRSTPYRRLVDKLDRKPVQAIAIVHTSAAMTICENCCVNGKASLRKNAP